MPEPMLIVQYNDTKQSALMQLLLRRAVDYMIISHNLDALKTLKRLSRVEGKTSDSLSKLSSGLRINMPTLVLNVGANTGNAFKIHPCSGPTGKSIACSSKVRRRYKYRIYTAWKVWSLSQNALEHSASNLVNAEEILTAAESRIREVDRAKEMTNFQKNNILSQAAQAMIAQANQLPQGVLQLLH